VGPFRRRERQPVDRVLADTALPAGRSFSVVAVQRVLKDIRQACLPPVELGNGSPLLLLLRRSVLEAHREPFLAGLEGFPAVAEEKRAPRVVTRHSASHLDAQFRRRHGRDRHSETDFWNVQALRASLCRENRLHMRNNWARDSFFANTGTENRARKSGRKPTTNSAPPFRPQICPTRHAACPCRRIQERRFSPNMLPAAPHCHLRRPVLCSRRNNAQSPSSARPSASPSAGVEKRRKAWPRRGQRYRGSRAWAGVFLAQWIDLAGSGGGDRAGKLKTQGAQYTSNDGKARTPGNR
jgi:hypothetical protein